MTLTEKWKKGELPRGWYYVLLFSNEEYIAFIDGKWVVDDRLVESDITEVLAPVPTYQEYQQFCALLKECKNIIAHDCWQKAQFPNGQIVERQDLLTRINAVIGESEE